MEIFTIDFETTGKDPKLALPIEVGLASFSGYATETFIALPDGETVPPETSAIHHIMDADLVGAPSWPDVVNHLWRIVNGGNPSVRPVLAAHNAEYEQGVLCGTPLDPQVGNVDWICTYKVALVQWPEAPSHSNEALRYWLGHGVGRSGQTASHSALHDARVTLDILGALLTHYTVDEMVAISKGPKRFPRCPIGKHRGEPWSQIPSGYLRWMVQQADMDADIKACAQAELDRGSGH